MSGSSGDRVLLEGAPTASVVRDETSPAPATAAAFCNKARRPMVVWSFFCCIIRYSLNAKIALLLITPASTGILGVLHVDELIAAHRKPDVRPGRGFGRHLVPGHGSG